MAKKRIAVVTPTRDGLVDISYTQAVFNLQKILGDEYDVELTLQMGVSDIATGRNKLWNKWYYYTDVEYLFWVDSDIAFSAGDIKKLLEYEGCDIIGGNYPKKLFDAKSLLECASLMQQFDGQVEAIKALEASMHYVASGQTSIIEGGSKNGLARTDRLGLGCCLVSREGAKRLMDWAEKNMEKVRWDWNGDECEGYGVFNPVVSSEGFQYGEDYSFFERCGNAGVELWFHPEMRLRHTGMTSFDGNFNSVVELAKQCAKNGANYPGTEYENLASQQDVETAEELKPEFED